MPSIRIEAPSTGKNVSTERAAEWLGVSEDTFKRIVPQFPWVKPLLVGRKVLWDVVDVALLGHVLSRLGEIDPSGEVAAEKKPEKV